MNSSHYDGHGHRLPHNIVRISEGMFYCKNSDLRIIAPDNIREWPVFDPIKLTKWTNFVAVFDPKQKLTPTSEASDILED